MLSRASVWVCLAVVLGAGCTAPLDRTATVTLDHGGDYLKTYDLDGQPKEQTIKVEVTAPDSEVDVFIITADKQAEFDKATGEGRVKAAAASQIRTNKASISATVPPKTDVRVLVQLVGTKKTEATIRMTNRK